MRHIPCAHIHIYTYTHILMHTHTHVYGVVCGLQMVLVMLSCMTLCQTQITPKLWMDEYTNTHQHTNTHEHTRTHTNTHEHTRTHTNTHEHTCQVGWMAHLPRLAHMPCMQPCQPCQHIYPHTVKHVNGVHYGVVGGGAVAWRQVR